MSSPEWLTRVEEVEEQEELPLSISFAKSIQKITTGKGKKK